MDNNKALEVFADLMIEKIKEVSSSDWQKPWFSSVKPAMNIDGRFYKGINAPMLLMEAEQKKYEIPVFLTFNQAVERGVSINKGAKSFPVIYWNFSIKDELGKSISIDDYSLLSEAEKQLYTVKPYMKIYNVFNLSQTNFPTVKEQQWHSLLEKFSSEAVAKDVNFELESLDTMLSNQEWICPISVQDSDRAFYSSTTNSITVPKKEQYSDDRAFYSVLLHEMAHSTAPVNNRVLSGSFGSPSYAKEELIAEMTSAVSGVNLGISVAPLKENAEYLKSWLNSLREEPKFIYEVLSDVNKATDKIMLEVERVEQVYSLTPNNKKDLSEQMKLLNNEIDNTRNTINETTKKAINKQQSSQRYNTFFRAYTSKKRGVRR